MKNARSALLLLALALAAPLCACGNKGPLVHPDEAEKAAAADS